jgi:type IV pilus assembly protein PilQ
LYPHKKSIKRSVALLVFTSFFGAPNIAQGLFFTESRKQISLNNNSIFSALKISDKDNASRYQNQLIASSIANPNLLEIEGPKVSLVFKQAKAKEIFEYLAKIGNYGFVWVRNKPNDESKVDNDRLISMTLNEESYEKAFNALLLASGLQAKLHDNVLYVGPNVRDTVFTERATDVFQLNQISASSAADYLANLGASVTKTFTITTSVTSGTSQSQAVQGASSSSTTTDQSETSVKVYGASIGPLVGLIATTDERLQTVTMVGEDQLIDLAKSFLEKLDIRQKQVALSVKVLDVNLSDKNSSMKDYGGTFDDAFIIGTQGKIKSAFGAYLPTFPDAGGSLDSVPSSPAPNKSFFGLLEASMENGSTKVLASPTLLLSESKLTDAGNDKGIGRKIGSEGFVVIGDKVPVDATQGDGGACSYSYDTVGVSLGAKILGIDENNYVTFTMTPIVTGISGTFNVVGCGSVSKINNRRLDTGAIRIKDGETLVLTGIIQETDVDTTYKYPILGDIPLLGALFRSKQTNNDQRELIILVTPKVLDDDTTDNNKKYDLEFISDDAKILYKDLNKERIEAELKPEKPEVSEVKSE